MVSSGVRALPRTAPQLCPAHHTALCNAGLSGWVSPADLESPSRMSPRLWILWTQLRADINKGTTGI